MKNFSCYDSIERTILFTEFCVRAPALRQDVLKSNWKLCIDGIRERILIWMECSTCSRCKLHIGISTLTHLPKTNTLHSSPSMPPNLSPKSTAQQQKCRHIAHKYLNQSWHLPLLHSTILTQLIKYFPNENAWVGHWNRHRRSHRRRPRHRHYTVITCVCVCRNSSSLGFSRLLHFQFFICLHQGNSTLNGKIQLYKFEFDFRMLDCNVVRAHACDIIWNQRHGTPQKSSRKTALIAHSRFSKTTNEKKKGCLFHLVGCCCCFSLRLSLSASFYCACLFAPTLLW